MYVCMYVCMYIYIYISSIIHSVAGLGPQWLHVAPCRSIWSHDLRFRSSLERSTARSDSHLGPRQGGFKRRREAGDERWACDAVICWWLYGCTKHNKICFLRIQNRMIYESVLNPFPLVFQPFNIERSSPLLDSATGTLVPGPSRFSRSNETAGRESGGWGRKETGWSGFVQQ